MTIENVFLFICITVVPAVIAWAVIQSIYHQGCVDEASKDGPLADWDGQRRRQQLLVDDARKWEAKYTTRHPEGIPKSAVYKPELLNVPPPSSPWYITKAMLGPGDGYIHSDVIDRSKVDQSLIRKVGVQPLKPWPVPTPDPSRPARPPHDLGPAEYVRRSSVKGPASRANPRLNNIQQRCAAPPFQPDPELSNPTVRFRAFGNNHVIDVPARPYIAPLPQDSAYKRPPRTILGSDISWM